MEKPTGFIQKIIESLQQVNALDVYSPIEKDIILHNLRAAYMTILNIQVEEGSTANRIEKLFDSDEMMRRLDDEMVEDEVVEDEINEPSVIVNVEDIIAVSKELEPASDQFDEEPVEEYQSVEELQPVAEVEELQPAEELQPVEELQPIEELQPVEEVEELQSAEEYQPVEEVEELQPAEEYQPVEEVEELQPAEEYQPIEEPVVIEDEQTFHIADVSIEPKNTLQDDLLEFIPDAKPSSSLLFEDMPKTEKKSLNDLLTEKKDDQSLGTKFQQSYIPDLTKAIAINEKFTFIRELFKNSGVDFSNAIQKLNECENIDTAFVLMEDLKHQYLWDTTSTSYLSLCDLVRRRFL